MFTEECSHSRLSFVLTGSDYKEKSLWSELVLVPANIVDKLRLKHTNESAKRVNKTEASPFYWTLNCAIMKI